jgi:hypothetical protein
VGCDVHVFVEKQYDDLQWELDSYHKLIREENRVHVKKLYIGRNYALFAKMAGVRGFKTLFGPRGRPPDASPGYASAATIYKFTRNNYHSESYLSYDEFQQCLIACGKLRKPIGNNRRRTTLKEDEYGMVSSTQLLEYMNHFRLSNPGFDARIVFFFDS